MSDPTAAGRLVRDYYEAEALAQLRKPLSGWRAEQRDAFIELLESEARSTVVDFGAGPGRDLEGFAAAGLQAMGIDLAVGNAHLARSRGLTVIPASVTTPPLRANAFQAGWSMSTLMHLDHDQASAATTRLIEAIEPGGPVWVGLWGGDGGVRWDDSRTIAGQRRPFYRRTLAANRAIFAAASEVEHAEELQIGEGHYHLFHLRTR